MIESEIKQFLEPAALPLIALAVAEDLHDGTDVTSNLMIERTATGEAIIVARKPGIVCGLPLISLIRDKFEADFQIDLESSDGEAVSPGTSVAKLKGSTLDLLKTERTILNFLGRLSGIATLTHRYCQQVKQTDAKIYDTRKTTPGWRVLEKYAVKCGGGTNHRMGLFDAVLVKDNHLAAARANTQDPTAWLHQLEELIKKVREDQPEMKIEVEVDTLEQFGQVITLKPDMILLDNMSNDQLQQAVQSRGQVAVELEASGNVNLQTVRGIAETGVERISVGALTHSATNFDWGLDWHSLAAGC